MRSRSLFAVLSLTLATTALAVPSFAADPPVAWPGASTTTTVDVAGSLDDELSGLAYDGTSSATRGTLWAVDNGDSRLFKLRWNGTAWVAATTGGWSTGKALKLADGLGRPDSEGLTLTSGGSSAGIYVSSERDATHSTVSRLSVLKYDVSGSGALPLPLEWDLTAQLLPPVEANSGIESVAWVPDSYLTAKTYQFGGVAYDPDDFSSHADGIFVVGLEKTGMLYAFMLQDSGDITLLNSFSSGLPNVSDLHWDNDEQQLWAECDNGCDGQLARLEVDSAGVFTAVDRVNPPAGLPDLNNEGFTIAPSTECVAGKKPVYWSEDGRTGGHSMRQGLVDCFPTGPGDTVAPTVSISGPRAGATYLGVVPAARCVGADSGSGVTTCTVTTTSKGTGAKVTVTVTAKATDRGLNTATKKITYTRLLTFVQGKKYAGGAFTVKQGTKVTVVAYAAAGKKPVLLLPVKAPTKPTAKGPAMRKSGTSGALTIWKATFRLPRKMPGTWQLGVKTGSTLVKVKLKQ